MNKRRLAILLTAVGLVIAAVITFIPVNFIERLIISALTGIAFGFIYDRY